MVAHTPVSSLIAPYGGSLVDLMVPAEACDEVKGSRQPVTFDPVVRTVGV